MSSRVLNVISQEYRSTVLTKAFIFGTFVFPVIFYGLIFVIAAVVDPEPPAMQGKVAIYDAGGWADPYFRQELDAARIDAQKAALDELTANPEKREELREQAQAVGGGGGGEVASTVATFAARMMNPLLDQPTPQIEFEDVELPSEVMSTGDQEARAAALAETRTRMQDRIRTGDLLAYVEFGPRALEVMSPEPIALLTPPDLHQRHQRGLEHAVRQGALQARLASTGLDFAQTQVLMTPPAIETRNVTEEGAEKSIGEAQFFIPLAFMMLLWISTFTGGQYLLMSTIEEKSSRVMEVMLSAVSPRQLMVGKIIGQGAVALTMLAVYAGLGIAGLQQFDLGHLVATDRVLTFIPYFFMAFLFVACVMASIGAAVTDVREAQALMGPAMMVMVVPFIVMVPVIENPNSALSVVLSFIPPLTPFIMAMRLGSNQAVPLWEVIATLIIGWAAVVGFIFVAAKIFRIGVLMYGKPPNFRTLMKWVAQA